MKELNHIDKAGRPKMVDISSKASTKRRAIAKGVVRMKPETLDLIKKGGMKKGEVMTTARLAGIMAAKRTADLIPLCHPLPLTHIDVICTPNPKTSRVEIEATARVRGKTGVEMEALTAVTVAALTIYDMAKAVDRGMRIGDIHVVEKSGGKSGRWTQDGDNNLVRKGS